MRQKAAQFRTKKRNPFVSKFIIFQNETSRIRYRREFGAAEILRVSVHELNVTYVEFILVFRPKEISRLFYFKAFGKNPNRKRKANLF